MMSNYERILIDGDILLYRAAFVAEKTGDSDTGEMAFYMMMRRAIHSLNCDTYTIYLTGKGNFREEVAVTQPYKGNRPPRPKFYKEMREYVESLPQTVVINGMEADDALGIDQIPGRTVIASIDKDLLMIPGAHYNLVTGELTEASDPGELTLTKSGKRTKLKGYGFKWFCAQMLTGDRIDNIKGLHRVGDVTAYNILKDCNTEYSMILAVARAYKEHKQMHRFRENIKLLWILREEEYEDEKVK